ncbi:MAG: histidine kinase, partial [Betaproteobacteria bacterium]
EERRRLAQEVHDDIGTTLTALKFELARLGRDLGDQPVAAPRLLAMNELLAHAVADSHRNQHNLHPPVLDAGLAAALPPFIAWPRKLWPIAPSMRTRIA